MKGELKMVRKCTFLSHVSLCVLLLCSIATRTAWAQVPREIFVDVPVSGHIENSTEKRYYFIRISGTGPLFVHLQKSQGAEVGVAVHYNSLNNPPVKQIEDGADILLMVDTPEPGIYYIVLYPYRFAQGLPLDYTLTVRRRLDEVTPGQPFLGRITAGHQRHWYQLQVSGSGPLFVHLQKSQGAEVGVAVHYNSLNNPPVKRIEDRADILLMVDTPEPGIYYIVLYPYRFAQGLPLDYTLTVWVLPFNEVSGVIDLLDYDGDMTQIPVLIQIRNPGEVTPIGQHEVFLDSSGRFYFVTSLEGVYDFAAKAPHWLRRVEPGVQITSSTVVNFTLINGDIDGDNEVTLFDFGQLVAAFGSVPGAPHWNADADLDGDEEVTLFDFGVLVRNFGVMGDE
jgi:hypothetical protein